MNHKKNLLGFLLLMLTLPTIYGCGENILSTQKQSTNDQPEDDEKITVTNQAECVLTVNESRCNGCGRCARIDSEHFVIDHSARVSVVISQENLNSEDLQDAINGCHHYAITL